MTIKEILMKRDGISDQEAIDLINECQDALYEYLEDGDLDGAYNVCQEYLGLEPDYVTELLF